MCVYVCVCVHVCVGVCVSVCMCVGQKREIEKREKTLMVIVAFISISHLLSIFSDEESEEAEENKNLDSFQRLRVISSPLSISSLILMVLSYIKPSLTPVCVCVCVWV